MAGRRAEGRFADARGELHPWRILPRRAFDARLAAWAERTGAELRQRHRLIGIEWDASRRLNRLRVATAEGERTLTAPVVIGADGAASRVARDRGLARAKRELDAGLCVGLRGYVDWPRSDGRTTVVGDPDLLPGVAWIVPQPDGRANVGLGMIESDRRRRRLALKARLDRFLAEHAPAATRVDELAGWRLPAGGLRRRLAADGVLLIGDAAGLIDPFTGHGIHNAVHSGLIAADVAERAVRAADPLSSGPIGEYRRLLDRALGSELRLGSALQRFHARAGWVGVALARAAPSRRWADRFIGLAGHVIAKREALGPAFWLDFVRPPGAWPSG